jgi:hypothetical protein
MMLKKRDVQVALFKNYTMRYKVDIIRFIDLISLYKENKLNLNPPYQRNSIWTINNQRLLIDTIRKGMPLPTFFLQNKKDGFEMVDGQQRTRAFLSYLVKDFCDINDIFYTDNEFDDYLIAIVKLDEDLTEEEVREFYVRVNRSGAKLERPELNKAEYFNTKFLAVTTKISEMVEFRELKIVKNAQVRRMFDRDFIEEISALILNGPQEKKKNVDELYKSDITDEQSIKIETTFKSVLEQIASLNSEIQLSDTRFVQKNDFYTFFNLILDLNDILISDLIKLYKILIFVSKGISPSNEDCKPLKEYADNCVSQSNSKNARLKRLEILKEILLNQSNIINQTQIEVSEYYEISKELVHVGKYFTLKIN